MNKGHNFRFFRSTIRYIGLSIMSMHNQAAGFSLQASGFGGGQGCWTMPVARSEMYVVGPGCANCMLWTITVIDIIIPDSCFFSFLSLSQSFFFCLLLLFPCRTALMPNTLGQHMITSFLTRTMGPWTCIWIWIWIWIDDGSIVDGDSMIVNGE